MKKKIVSLLCIIALFSTTLTGTFGATYAETEPSVKEVTISETISAEISLVQEEEAAEFFAVFNTYGGSYYSELSVKQQKYYEMMETAYLTNDMPNGKIDGLAIALSKNEYPVTVENNGGKVVLTAASSAIVNEIYNDISYAYFAFVYDHPQLFWASGIQYGVEYSYYVDAERNPTGEGFLTKISMAPQLAYAEAASQSSQFVNGVNEAVAEIEKRRDNTTAYATTKAIHDYLCDKITYNHEAAAATDSSAYKYAHSAGPVFTKAAPSVVCEGYGKAFKILCDRFNIPCAMIVGKGNSEAHLWNYVQIESLWYAVDVTWDDQSSIIYDYFLVGEDSMNDHTEINTAFSANGTISFAYPDLNVVAYQLKDGDTVHEHRWDTGEVTKAATCKEKGIMTYKCIGYGCGYTTTGEAPSNPNAHQWDSGKVTTPPTCAAAGVKTFTCKHNSAHTKTEAIAKKTTHTWNAGKVTKAATCTAAGVKTYTCTVSGCGATKTEAIAAKGHTKTTIAAVKATTSKSGKTAGQKCTVCGVVTTAQKTVSKIKTVKLSTAEYAYNGKTKSPSLVIKDANGKTLKNKVDYTYSKPSGRKSIGKYTYTVKFKGNYTGTKKLTLTIKPVKPTLNTPKAAKKAITVKWKKGKKAQVTGYQVMVATNSKFTKNKKTATVKGYSKVSKKMTKLKAKTKYYVRVRTYKTVKGVKIYSDWSKAKTCKTK